MKNKIESTRNNQPIIQVFYTDKNKARLNKLSRLSKNNPALLINLHLGAVFGYIRLPDVRNFYF